MPDVTVILPTCDRPHLVGRSLASVLQQTWADLEIILVDNNRLTPPVGENPALDGLLRDPRIVIVRDTASTNASQSRNQGLRHARGSWITYLDDDDTYHPDKVEAQMQRALATGSPLVVCGYTVVLTGRRRTPQVDAESYQGDELLLDTTWGTPFLFHRADPSLRFDETLPAGHDELLAHQMIVRYDLRVVPNCARPLVNVYPQTGRPRVHADFAEIWRAYRATARVVGRRYSVTARRTYLLRGMLVRAQGGDGSWGHCLRLAGAVWRERGGRDWRLVLNSLAYRLKFFRRFIVT